MKTIPDAFIDDTWATMATCPQHTFLILTKRPRRMLFTVSKVSRKYGILENVWSGLTVCHQQEWNDKKNDFLSVPGLKFISYEPALERIDYGPEIKEIACLIAGGETGLGARPLHPDWVRSVRDQCQAAGIPFFFKQWGEWVQAEDLNFYNELEKTYTDGKGNHFLNESKIKIKRGFGRERLSNGWTTAKHYDSETNKVYLKRVGRKNAGRLLDGREYNDLPWRNK